MTDKAQAKDDEERAVIYCDGACSGNPGPGGWGAILVRINKTVEELGGRERQTTNNQMELMAATQALERAAKEDVPVSICTDSTYVIRGITQWIFGWKRKGWIATNGEPVANRAYWERLHEVVMKISPKRPSSAIISRKFSSAVHACGMPKLALV